MRRTFASAALNFMSRAATALNGAGDLDEVALYDRALNAGKPSPITSRAAAHNIAPEASFTVSPNPTATGDTVNFDAAGSKDPDGTIAKYDWDLDGNGTYETNSGTSPTTSRAYATPGARTIGLRVTDNGGATATTTRTLTIQNTAPTASFTASPSPVQTGKTVSLNAAGSSDSDGTIAKYEWDLDGNGSYETDGGATASDQHLLRDDRAAHDRPAGDRQQRRHGDDDAQPQRPQQPADRLLHCQPEPGPDRDHDQLQCQRLQRLRRHVAKYEWDLDGNGSYETSTGATASTSKSFATAGDRTIGLRITDNNGGTATSHADGGHPEPRSQRLLHDHSEQRPERRRDLLQRRRLERPRRDRHQIRVGLRRQRDLRDGCRRESRRPAKPSPLSARSRSACG